MIFASWGPLGRPLGGLLGRLGGLLGRLGAILGVLERSFVGSEAFSIVWTALPGGLGPFWGPRGRGDRPGGPRGKHSPRPGRPGNLGVWAPKNYNSGPLAAA